MMVEGLGPGTTTYFNVATLTAPHPDNQGTVVSEASAAVPGSTAPPGSPGAFQLSLSGYRGSEGEAKAITVRRVGGASGAVSVRYTAGPPGTATPGSDYALTSEWLSWDTNDEEAKTFLVYLLDDAEAEGEETLTVALSDPGGGAGLGSPAVAEVTVDDNDLVSGAEGEVNSGGSEPGVASDPNGVRTVVWAEQRDGSFDVVAQRYDASGSSTGERIAVDGDALGDQRLPAVGATSSGSSVVAWMGATVADGERQGGGGIFGRVFGPGGAPTTPPFQMNGTLLEGVTSVGVGVMPTTGAFVVVWEGDPAGRTGNGIFGRIFGGGGTPVTPEIPLAGGENMVVSHPSVAVDADGEWVAAWSRQDDLGWDDVYAQRFDGEGHLVGPEVLVNLDTYRHQTAASVGLLPGGELVVLWQGTALDRQPGSDVFLRRFGSDGSAQGDPVVVNLTLAGTQRNPCLVMNGAGECWAVWEQDDAAGGVAVRGRMLSTCSVPTGDELALSDTSGNPTVRHATASLSDTGALTAVFVEDDLIEGDGSVVGYSVGQPAAGWLFGDGFERGTTSAWSRTVP
jgi:hypothetical protein